MPSGESSAELLAKFRDENIALVKLLSAQEVVHPADVFDSIQRGEAIGRDLIATRKAEQKALRVGETTLRIV